MMSRSFPDSPDRATLVPVSPSLAGPREGEEAPPITAWSVFCGERPAECAIDPTAARDGPGHPGSSS